MNTLIYFCLLSAIGIETNLLINQIIKSIAYKAIADNTDDIEKVKRSYKHKEVAIIKAILLLVCILATILSTTALIERC